MRINCVFLIQDNDRCGGASISNGMYFIPRVETISDPGKTTGFITMLKRFKSKPDKIKVEVPTITPSILP